MRHISIDLSSDNYLERPQIFGGYAGEHNETILQVKLPKRMIGIECSGYRFDFQTSEDNKISSPLIPISELNNDILSFHLTQQLTIAGKLLFNVIAILSDENTVSMISKTNTVTLRIEDAVDGNMQLIDPNGYKDELQKMVDERIMEINPAKVDQTFDPESENAQSGGAVDEAVLIEQKRANNTFANALKGSKSGSAILIDDISPITHKLSVKLSSNAIGDEYITYAEGYTTSGVDFEFKQLPDTILKTSPINSSEQYSEFILIHADGKYTSLISVGESVRYEGDVYYTKIVLGDKPYVYYYSDSNYTTLITSWLGDYSTSSPIVGIRFNASQIVYYTAQTKYIPLTSIKVIVKNNNGETVAEYTPNADGTVDGVKSLYPTTVITTDTDGVTIDCEYNKDLNKLRVAHWEKLLDITIDEEVNSIILTSDKMPQCKEFILRAIFPVSTTGETVSLGAAYCYLNNNISAFRFTATDINKSVITEQRCHILIADNLIYSTGTEGASGQAAIVANVKTIVGNRVITDNVTQIIYKLNDSTKSYQIGTQFQVYGKVEK